jgi:hypothetical protein
MPFLDGHAPDAVRKLRSVPGAGTLVWGNLLAAGVADTSLKMRSGQEQRRGHAVSRWLPVV